MKNSVARIHSCQVMEIRGVAENSQNHNEQKLTLIGGTVLTFQLPLPLFTKQALRKRLSWVCRISCAFICSSCTMRHVGVGVVCSVLFVAFPSKRDGIGFSHSAN
ncbi:hypothetical protein NC651_026554 [Populus alba x Populus x berolinensis]|nr:hypothetical protein NC651_026554 [Populus alba x Populus x berolinensis]